MNMINLKTMLIISMLGLLSQSCQAQIGNPLYELFLKGFLSHSVSLISVEKLAQQEDTTVILDTRQKEEYHVSHIKNARWVGFESFAPSKVEHLPRDTTVVLYCSVGYRSEKIGEELQKMGFEDVYNLHGGIFEWTNQQMELYTGDTTTTRIHPYSPTWGIWLNKGEKTYP